MVRDDAGDNARGHGHQHIVPTHLHPLLPAVRRRKAVLAGIGDNILRRAQTVRHYPTANKFWAACVVVVAPLLFGALVAPVVAALFATHALIALLAAVLSPIGTAVMVAVVRVITASVVLLLDDADAAVFVMRLGENR